MTAGEARREADQASGGAAKGVIAMVAACTVWGLSPLYYAALAHVPPGEVLAHRTLWPAAGFLLWLGIRGRLGEVRALLRGRAAGQVALAALFISVNWYLFILAIQTGHAVEASLGYYIFPLVSVLLGVLAFGERLARRQALAVGIAGFAVALLTWGLGAAPWFALALAGSFALYGVMKKRLAAGPVVSVTAELLLLAPVAAIWLAGVHGGLWSEAGRAGGWFGRDAATTLLLAASGIITSAPLMLFSYAARRVTMATMGLVQYLNPTLQFLCAAVIFAEPVTGWHTIAFGLIWAALALYSLEALRQERARRRGAAGLAAP